MRRTRILLLLAAASLAIAACGSSNDNSTSSASSSSTTAKSAAIKKNAANSKVTLTVGSKNFTEQKVLGEIYGQALKAAGYNVKLALDLGDEQVALKAMKGGQISGYPEYTGTVLSSFLKVPAAKLPLDAAKAYDQAKAGMAKQGIVAYPPTPFTDSNAVGMLKSKAQQLGVTKISDLKPKASNLVLYGSPECRTRLDCLLGLQKVYGLQFKKFVPIDLDQRNEVLKNGDADVSIVFTTDPQIKRYNEVVLADDKHMFPPYQATFLLPDKVAKQAGPDFAKVVAIVNKNLTAPVMQELNARVEIDKDTPEQAAQAYLKQFKLIPS